MTLIKFKLGAYIIILLILVMQIGACKKKNTESPAPEPSPTKGVFLPSTLNSTWTYDSGIAQSVVTVTSNNKSVFSKTYHEYKLLYNSVTTSSYYAFANNEYTSLYYDSTAGNQEITYLKESPFVGQKWNDTITVSSTKSIYKYEVMETGLTVKNGALTFADAVHVKLTIGTTYTSDAYYVKNVGLIKTITNNNSTITTSLLRAYLIK